MADYSPQLTNSLSETLALVGSNGATLENATQRSRWAPDKVVRELLHNALPGRWVELQSQLPDLAEAAPDEFLRAVQTLVQNPDRVSAIYAEEGQGFMGRGNPLTGMLWALEALAWNPEYLPEVTLALGALDTVDPGGTWGNRARNTLTHIFLPWFPQTSADVSERKNVLSALSMEYAETAWEVYLSLLPGATQTSSQNYKPKWRDFGQNRERTVNRTEYWEQVGDYAARVVALAENDLGRLPILASKLDQLPEEEFDSAVRLLGAVEASLATSSERYDIWRALQRLVTHHGRFPDADWSMGEDRVQAVSVLVELFEPDDKGSRYLPLFSSSNYELFEEEENWAGRERKLREAQIAAANDVWRSAELRGMRALASSVDNPFSLGLAFGATSTDIPTRTLRQLVSASESDLEFLAGYLSGRHLEDGQFLLRTQFTNWEPDEIAAIFARLRLPDSKVWRRAESLLGSKKEMYWRKTDLQFVEDPHDLHHVVLELLSAGRPLAAVRAINLHWQKEKSLNTADAITALLAAADADDPPSGLDGHHVMALIQALQSSADASEVEMAKLEWAYLGLLARPGQGSPLTLERKLSKDPHFFCDVVRVIFRPQGTPPPTSEPTERERQVASSAYRLLMEWKTPPGQLNGSDFDGDLFATWLNAVVKDAKETGHLDVALHQLGPVLVFVPADPTGFWINRIVAEQLNRGDMQELRTGYRNGIFNSRGAYWVDPSGAPELELAREYFGRADHANAIGLVRLATTMRQLAKEYKAEAERVKTTHGYEDFD